MRILGIVQARVDSTRLPGKVLLRPGGHSVLGRVIRAAADSGAVDDLLVATSTDPTDDPIVTECGCVGVACYRGDPDDVLTRFIGALEANPADAVMRFTADSPLIDPEIVALVGRAFRGLPGVDYLSTSITRMLPLGLDAEVIRATTLRAVDRLAVGHHRSHVTSYAYTHPTEFRVLGLALPPDRSHLRLTLDTPEDWRLIQAVVAHFGDAPAPVAKVVDWLAAHPEIMTINAHVTQKALHEG